MAVNNEHIDRTASGGSVSQQQNNNVPKPKLTKEAQVDKFMRENPDVWESHGRAMEQMGIYGETAKASDFTGGSQITSNDFGGDEIDPRQQQIQDSFGNMRDESINQAKAQYDSMLENEINQLRNAYQQAVTDGEISMAEARRDFEKHKGEIEQDHYRNTEFTNLYGNQMGIQNSQQMMGLQKGDQARAGSMHNENRQIKQQRIADVKTRLDGIRNIKMNNIASATAQRDLNVAQATSQANMNYSQQMGQFQTDTFHADREQEFTQDNMHLDDELTKGQMEFQDTMEQNRMHLQAEIDKGLMDHEQVHRLEQMAEKYKIDLSLMNHDQMLQLERMDKQHEHVVDQMGIKFKFDTKLNAQQIAGQLSAISASGAQERRNIQARTAGQIRQMEAQFQKQFDAEQKQYELETERQLAQFTPNSNEWKIRKGQREQGLDDLRSELEMKAEVGIKAGLQEIATNAYVTSVYDAQSAKDVSRPNPNDSKYNRGGGGSQSYSNFGGVNVGGSTGDGQFQNDMKNYRGLVNNDRYRESLDKQLNLFK